MSISPLFDASVAGTLANASLCEASAKKAAAPGGSCDFNSARACACPIADKTKWRRWIDVLLSPISGPRFERTHP
jgi:hypothetical protein